MFWADRCNALSFQTGVELLNPGKGWWHCQVRPLTTVLRKEQEVFLFLKVNFLGVHCLEGWLGKIPLLQSRQRLAGG